VRNAPLKSKLRVYRCKPRV